MDGTRFDALARGFSARLTRRRAIAALVGLAGATLAVGAADDALARTCRLADAKCVNNAQCCSGSCDTARSTPRSRRNRCVCEATATICRGLCKELSSDEQNCGSCGVHCIAEQTCTGGECICDDSNAIVCDGVCTDITTPEHCGPSCQACDPGYDCVDGACTCGGSTCTATQACCNDTCIEVTQDNNNCGACGNVCGAGGLCIGSVCREACTPINQGACYWCAVLVNGETVSIDGYEFNSNPACTTQDDCAAGDLCMRAWGNSDGTQRQTFQTGICMTVNACR